MFEKNIAAKRANYYYLHKLMPLHIPIVNVFQYFSIQMLFWVSCCPFYTLKTRPKYAKYVKWPKYHIRVAKACSLKMAMVAQFSPKWSNFLGDVLHKYMIDPKLTKMAKWSEILLLFWFTLVGNFIFVPHWYCNSSLFHLGWSSNASFSPPGNATQ